MLRFLPLILASLRRRKLRTLFTLLSITVAFLLYGLLAAVKNGFDANLQGAVEDRLVTMHKVSIVQPLPISYLERIASVPGVKIVTHSTWFGGHYQDERNVIAMYPVPPESYLAVYPEYVIPVQDRERWLHDREGILVGRALAATHGWKVGDRIPLRSDIYAQRDGTFVWNFVIDAIYDNKEPGGDVSSIFMHYDYLDESRSTGKGDVGFYIMRLDSAQHSAEIARAIDARFANSSAETKTGTEKAFVQSFASQTGDIGAIATSIGIAVFFTMLLVSANTMAQSVRERTNELMVLKTLGFSDGAVLALVIGESLLLTLLGGALGTALAQLLVSRLSTALSQYMSSFLLTPSSYLLAAALMLALGFAAGVFPAARASRLKIVDGLARH
jgi:putative ABC transport system permease protein